MEASFISKRQFNRIKHFLPVPRDNKIYDDRLVLSTIFWVVRDGFNGRIFLLYMALIDQYTGVFSVGGATVFAKIFYGLRDKIKIRNTVMLDSTYIKAHRTAASLRSDGHPMLIGRSRGGVTTKINLLCNEDSKPIDFCITSGQSHDAIAASALIEKNLRRIKNFIADKAYDASRIREMLKGKPVCIPAKSNRKNPESHDRALYKKRHVIENMFARLKDWRVIAMRYCRCAHTFHSFVCMELIGIFICVV